MPWHLCCLFQYLVSTCVCVCVCVCVYCVCFAVVTLNYPLEIYMSHICSLTHLSRWVFVLVQKLALQRHFITKRNQNDSFTTLSATLLLASSRRRIKHSRRRKSMETKLHIMRNTIRIIMIKRLKISLSEGMLVPDGKTGVRKQ